MDQQTSKKPPGSRTGKRGGPRRGRSRTQAVVARSGRSLPDEVSRQIVKDFITSEKVAAGELLPSESQLCEIYRVSRSTVRSAIKSLYEYGLISVRNGVGAVVLPRAHEIPHGLDRLASIDTFAIETGHRAGTADLAWDQVPADAEMSRKLRIPVGDPVLMAIRLKLVDDEPAAWVIDHMPRDLIDPDELKRKFRGSVLDVLLEDPTQAVDYADSEVKPWICDEKLARTLNRQEGDAVLYLDTTVVTVKGRPVIWGRIWLDPNHFRFAFRRRRFN
ncbi:MAG: GntR family transcriptional regulator [Parvibaculaceae bacterium]